VPAAWPDLTAAAFAGLEPHTAEERRLAGLDRAAVEAHLRGRERLDGKRGDDPAPPSPPSGTPQD
jgi:hypothetical protein